MEQTQPLKKRIVEVTKPATEQKETQRTSRIRQYCQYVPIAEVRANPADGLVPTQTQTQRQPLKQSIWQVQKQQQREQQREQKRHQQREQQVQQQREQQMEQQTQPPKQPKAQPQTQPQKQPQAQPQEQPQAQPQKQPQAQSQRQSLTQLIQCQLEAQSQAQPQSQPLTKPKSQHQAQSQIQPPKPPQAQSKTQPPSKPQTPPPPQPPAQSPSQPPSEPQKQPPTQPPTPNPTQTPAQAQKQPQMLFRTPPSARLQAQIEEHLQNQAQSRAQITETPSPQAIGTMIDMSTRQEQQTTMENGIQIIEHIYKEPPMMLNAWTQTSPEDLPNSDNFIIGDLRTAVLLAKIEQLQESLKESYDYISENLNVTITPVSDQEEEDPLPESPSPVVKNEVQTYRILSQCSDENNDIEIEISMEPEDVNDENAPPSPKYYKIRSDTPKTVKKETPEIVCGGYPKPLPEGEPLVEIGPNRTRVCEADFNKIAWTSASIATRKLLTIIFDRETLATHSMTGKASPAFKDLDKPVKGRLEASAVEDIIHVVSDKCGVSAKEVRSAITTKCADENKMLKLKEMKRLSGETKRPILGELRPRNSQGRKSNGN